MSLVKCRDKERQITKHITPQKPQLVGDLLSSTVQGKRDGRWMCANTRVQSLASASPSLALLYLLLSVFVRLSPAVHFWFSPSCSLQRNPSLKLAVVCLIHSSDVNVSHDLFRCPNTHAHTHTHTCSCTRTHRHTCGSDEYFFLSSNHVGEGTVCLCCASLWLCVSVSVCYKLLGSL